ncbi:MAG: hypothetical protein EBU26_06035 [Verrucomicrobia bacterium]|nr:hypothetical protein [Verrucomicrobiota bacterium]
MKLNPGQFIFLIMMTLNLIPTLGAALAVHHNPPSMLDEQPSLFVWSQEWTTPNGAAILNLL